MYLPELLDIERSNLHSNLKSAKVEEIESPGDEVSKSKGTSCTEMKFCFSIKRKIQKKQLMPHFIISAQIATLEMRDFPPSNPLTVFPL